MVKDPAVTQLYINHVLMTVYLDFQDQKTTAFSIRSESNATQQLFAKDGTLQGRAHSLRADPFAPAVGRQRTLVIQ